jgi:hypothetical protein
MKNKYKKGDVVYYDKQSWKIDWFDYHDNKCYYALENERSATTGLISEKALKSISQVRKEKLNKIAKS